MATAGPGMFAGKGARGRTDPERIVRWIFCGVAVAAFAAAATLTIARCSAMAADGMPMPGGWVLSKMWMPMPGQGWPAAAASFLGMWTPMMIAMMLPPLMP